MKGEAHHATGGRERGQDLIVPVSRARLLGDAELVEWLYSTNQLVERRSFVLHVPAWFEPEVLSRLCDIGEGSLLFSRPYWTVPQIRLLSNYLFHERDRFENADFFGAPDVVNRTGLEA